MARQGISKEQVYSAAAALREEGTAPTVQAVRERIGSGSFSTVSGHLAQWRAENADRAVADVPEIPEKVQDAFHRIWTTAARTAQESFETQREALEVLRREMEKERAEMGAEIARLETAIEEMSERAEGLDEALKRERQAGEGKERELTSLRIENARIDERLRASEERGSELREQLRDLQEKFAEVAKAKTPAAPARKKTTPKPQEP